MENSPKVKVYTELIKDSEDINAWTPEECFPVCNLNPLQKKQLGDINVIEIEFQGSHGDRSLTNKRFDEFQSFVSQYILNSGASAYLIKIEHKISLKNKIRSYKGIIPRDIKDKDYIELESDIMDGYSLITAIVSLNEFNISKTFDYFYDSTNCFILLTSLNVFSIDFLNDFSKKHVLINETTCLNYISIALDFCKDDSFIVRAAGDGGDIEIDLQIFTSINETGELTEKLSRELIKKKI
jgi:hypothetical protein